MKKFAIWANVENSQLLVLVEFPHLTYNQSEHEAYTVTERLNFLMLKCAKYSKTFPHLSITEQFGNLNLHLYDLVLMSICHHYDHSNKGKMFKILFDRFQ